MLRCSASARSRCWPKSRAWWSAIPARRPISTAVSMSAGGMGTALGAVEHPSTPSVCPRAVSGTAAPRRAPSASRARAPPGRGSDRAIRSGVEARDHSGRPVRKTTRCARRGHGPQHQPHVGSRPARRGRGRGGRRRHLQPALLVGDDDPAPVAQAGHDQRRRAARSARSISRVPESTRPASASSCSRWLASAIAATAAARCVSACSRETLSAICAARPSSSSTSSALNAWSAVQVATKLPSTRPSTTQRQRRRAPGCRGPGASPPSRGTGRPPPRP